MRPPYIGPHAHLCGTKLGIQGFRNGYVTRGILMDIPRLKGLPYLEPGTPIFVEDLEGVGKARRPQGRSR